MKTGKHFFIILFVLAAIAFAQGESHIELLNRAFTGKINKFVKIDSYGYALSTGMLIVYDISDPLLPVETKVLYFESECYDIEFKDNYAYVTNKDEGIFILDISDLSSPEIITSYYLRERVNAICSQDNNLFVATDDYIFLLDISIPTMPYIAFNCTTMGIASDVVIYDNYLFVSEVDYGIRIFDISYPGELNMVSEITGISSYYSSVILREDILYVADYRDGLFVFDFSIPETPTFLNNYYSDISTKAPVIDEDILYISYNNRAIFALDISDPDTVILHKHIISEYITSMQVFQDTLFIARGYEGFNTYDLSNPDTFYQISHFDEANLYGDICIFDKTLFVNQIFDGLYSIDCENPYNLEITNELNDLLINEMIYRNNMVYTISEGLNVIDVSSPEDPEIIGRYNTDIDFMRMCATDSILCLLYNFYDSSRVYLYDISLEDTIELKSIFESTYYYSISIHGDYLYAKGLDSLLDIINITDPHAPFIESSPRNFYGRNKFYFHEGYAYRIETCGQIDCINIDDPLAPFIEGTYNAGCSYGVHNNDACFVGDFAFLTFKDNITVIDISDPRNPGLVERLETDIQSANSICIRGNILYMTDKYSGLRVYDLSYYLESIDEQAPNIIPEKLSLSTYPNPFNSAVSIELPVQANKIEIYDINGKICHKSSVKTSIYTWQPSEELESGVYIVKTSDNKDFNCNSNILYVK